MYVHKLKHTHTFCLSLTLLRTVVMATPLREDTQTATVVKSARLSYTSLPLFKPHARKHAHTHNPSFSSTASHFYLSLTITFSFSPIVLLPLCLHHPWHTSLPLSLHYSAIFCILSHPASHFPAKCKYVASPLKPSSCLYL